MLSARGLIPRSLAEFFNLQCYNAQAAGAAGSLLVVAVDVVQAPGDKQQLEPDPARMAWCRMKLQATIDNPPASRRFDSEMSVGDNRWDAFAAESGISLLAADRHDVLARQLVLQRESAMG